MQAIILAAGMGRRLKELTKNNTKCMVEVNGEKLISRVLKQLDQLGLSKIVLVIGYQGKDLKEYVQVLHIQTPVTFIWNRDYDKTNNIYSLYLAREYLVQEDTILLESDLIFEDSVLEKLVNDQRDTLALVAKYEDWMDGTCLVLDSDDNIVQFVPGKNMDYSQQAKYFKTVNIYKFSKQFSQTLYVPFLEAYSKALGNNEYYEQVIKVIIMLDDPGIKACRLTDEKWYEIDDVQDLEIASSLFAKEEEKVKCLQRRYGGYWRYPKLLDFCYLVNPYYPPEQMLKEMKANFDQLIIQYPSGMNVITSLAEKNFAIHAENILAGNGAAELIKSLLGHLTGKLGLIRPTFEEYPNRYPMENLLIYNPDNADFSYCAEDIISFFENKKIDQLLLINPDNPSGNYLSREQVRSLISWTKKENVKFIVDESFSDFAEEIDNSLLQQQILEENPHLTVIKSISKSYGVPGLRLGILASGDLSLIQKLKTDVAIWNINSLGEYFLQIKEKYEKDYQFSLECLRKERIRFINELKKIQEIRVIPSQANYVMVELYWGTACDLTKRLLMKYDILIKDLSEKTGKEYIRIAVRNQEDNDKLLLAMRELLPGRNGGK